MKIQVYIPTRGRVGLDKQTTLREFIKYSTHRPMLVCPLDEVDAHKKYWSNVWGCCMSGIGPTRQWIMGASRADVVVVGSDDMTFAYRPDPTNVKLLPCTNLDPLIELIVKCVQDGYMHGAIGARQGNNHKMPDGKRCVLESGHVFTDCDRANELHYMDRSAVLQVGARWDQLTVMEDFHFTLTMLTKGHPNRCIHSYVWNQKGSNAEGGCSLYRTPQVQDAGARGLHAAFPQFVRVVTKKSKTVWKGMENRTDVVVYWLKAYQSSQVV